MTSLADWPDSGFCLRLVLTFGHFLWQGVLVLLAVTLACRMLRGQSAAARYRLLVGGLLLMAACPIATFLRTGDLTQTAMPPVSARPPALAPEMERTIPSRISAAAHKTPIPVVMEPARTRQLHRSPPLDPVAPTKSSFDWRQYAGYAVAFYVLGVLAMLGRLAMAVCGGQRLQRRSEPVQDNAILLMLSRQARTIGLRFIPAIAYCRDLAAPAVIGVLRPMILLPLSCACGLSPEQIEVLLAHELAHIRRYDHLVNLLQRLIEAALFFHPAVWHLSNRIRTEREHCCDDLVVAGGGKRVAYADLLLRVAELSRQAGRPRPIAAAVALGAEGQPSDLGYRIRRIIGTASHERVHLPRAWALALPLIALTALALGRPTPYQSPTAPTGPTAASRPATTQDTADNVNPKQHFARTVPIDPSRSNPSSASATRPASTEAQREALARLEREKTVEALNHLLEVNHVRIPGIEKLGNALETNENNDIRDVRRIRSAGTDYVVAIANRYSDDPDMRRLIKSGWGMIFIFREQGTLEGYLGGRPGKDGLNGDKPQLLTLGTPDRWFVWVHRFEKHAPFTYCSEVHLITPGLPMAFRVYHFPNSTSTTYPKSDLYTGRTPDTRPDATNAYYFWFRGEKDDARWGDKGVGCDGTPHDMFVGWDAQARLFRGASQLTRNQKPVYEIDLHDSALFRPTDLPGAK